jgi:hypothetical protein
VLAISSSFCLCPDLCLACPCPDRCHDPYLLDPVSRAISICADDRRARDPPVLCPDRGPGPCLCRDLVDLWCLGDRDLGIVNVNASDVCSSYEKKNTLIKKVRSK